MLKEHNKALDNKKEKLTDNKELILYNDEINTFDFVIKTLIEVCKHEPQQAEQCAIIAHLKGKCAVKSGTFYELKPIFDEMSSRNLTVEIE